MRDIGKNIKTLRTKQNMTQDELAQRLFVTRQTVSNYENGNSRPDVDMLLRIAEVFGVDVNTVIYGPQMPQAQKKKYISVAVWVGVTVLTGILLAILTDASKQYVSAYAEKTFLILLAAPLFIANWLKPAWLLLAGWTAMHMLCVCCDTKTLQPPLSRYIKWGIISLMAAYAIVILPHSVYWMVEDIKCYYRHANGFVGEYTSSFSVFYAWDWLALHLMNIYKPQNGVQLVFAVLDYLPLPFGALLRLCRKPIKE